MIDMFSLGWKCFFYDLSARQWKNPYGNYPATIMYSLTIYKLLNFKSLFHYAVISWTPLIAKRKQPPTIEATPFVLSSAWQSVNMEINAQALDWGWTYWNVVTPFLAWFVGSVFPRFMWWNFGRLRTDVARDVVWIWSISI